MFLGICPFLPDCPFYWHIITHNILLLFVFLPCWLWPLLFHSWFYWFGSFPFSFGSNWLGGLTILLIFSKNQLLLSLICSTGFLVSITLISALLFSIFCLLLVWDFICSCFSSSLRCKVRLCIWDLSSFFMKAWIAIYFPLMTAFAASQRFGLWCYHFHWLPCTFSFPL